jgi:uncharacterized protein
MAMSSELNESYYAIVHKPGKNWDHSKSSFDQMGIELHANYYMSMVEKGHLILGGPFLDGEGGLAIFKGNISLEEAKRIADSDPTVKSGLILAETHPWKVVMHKS